MGLVIGAVAAAASVVAVAAVRRRRVVNEGTKHPLKGSVRKRMNLFAMLAKHRNGRRATTAEYHNSLDNDVV